MPRFPDSGSAAWSEQNLWVYFPQNLFVDSRQWDKVNSIALDEAALYPETTAVFIVSDVDCFCRI